ncbi:MAG TPA: MFS transporter [Planctomycetota bacterium]
MQNEASPRGKWMALLAALLGWLFDGFEMGLFPLAGRPALRAMLAGSVPPGQLEGLVGTWFGYIIATFLLGAAAGGVLFGWLGDRVGRVKAMVWSVAVYSVFSGLCGFVGSPWQLMTLRFIASLGMGGEWALGVALVMEMWPSTSRPLMAGLIGAAANVGYLFVGFLSLGLDTFMHQVGSFLSSFLPETWVKSLLAAGGWRLLFVIGSLPAILTFLIRIFVPESEKWKQASEGQAKPRVAEIFAPAIRRSTILGATLAALALLGTWGSVQWIPAWADKFSNGAPGVKAWSQIAMSSGAIVFTIIAALTAQKTGRRIAYFVLCVLSLGICQFLFRSHPVYGTGFLWTVFFAGGLTAAFYGWLPLYLPELFPTRVRATGSGFSFNIGRVVAAAGTLVSGHLVKAFDGDYGRMCATISLMYVFGLVIWICPETKGKPLPE